LLSAERARQGLAADLHNINEAGENLLRHGKHQLKTTTLTHGAAAFGGLIAGVVLGRAGNGRRGAPLIGALLSRATVAFATALATQLVAKLLRKRS
jgi:hypothetical protein